MVLIIVVPTMMAMETFKTGGQKTVVLVSIKKQLKWLNSTLAFIGMQQVTT